MWGIILLSKACSNIDLVFFVPELKTSQSYECCLTRDLIEARRIPKPNQFTYAFVYCYCFLLSAHVQVHNQRRHWKKVVFDQSRILEGVVFHALKLYFPIIWTHNSLFENYF